jgi:hypothetical protein
MYMNADLSLTLTACLLFLILSSNFACKLIRKVAKMTDDMSTVARTVIFGLAFSAALRVL